MRADNPSLKQMAPPKLSWAERTYLPQILAGLAVTGKHMADVVIGGKALTVSYP